MEQGLILTTTLKEAASVWIVIYVDSKMGNFKFYAESNADHSLGLIKSQAEKVAKDLVESGVASSAEVYKAFIHSKIEKQKDGTIAVSVTKDYN